MPRDTAASGAGKRMNLFLFLAALLLAPMVFLRVNNGEVVHTWMVIASSIGLALVFVALACLARRRPAAAGVALFVLVAAAVIVRLLLAFLYDFSGRGFGSEVFIHANVTSLLVAWDEYADAIIGLFVLAAALGYLGARLARRSATLSRRKTTSLLAAGAALFAAGAPSSPEWMLIDAWYRYAMAGDGLSITGTADRESALEILAPIRESRTLPVTRRRIEASAPSRPYNLVMVYLESFNEMLTESERYPGLTPRINALKSRLAIYSPVYASAYLTIEGIANSQCGTLMNMEHANNSLITREGRLPLLPCLGDVLRVAGYHQEYLGGASLDFAGKGSFLREHGFDRAMGWEQWEARGLEAVAHWGISDAQLFEEALSSIERLRGGPRPFNLTLLTLGTHLPGFVYKGCPSYTNGAGPRFLDAVHCTDHLFGEFVDALTSRGVLEDTVLFVQADHGVFENPDMRELFGDDVNDKRLLTMVSLPPDAVRVAGPKLAADASVNTAPTVLDLLGIDHNVTFLLGRSRFRLPGGPEYILTRREDYLDGHPVENDVARCDAPPEGDTPITLPLDDCAKRRALDALRTLNLSYARAGSDTDTNQVCQLAVGVTVEPGDGRVAVKWGNEYLTRWFYHRGRRMPATDVPGVYAVVLDEADNVRRALFFGIDNDYDLWRLRQLVQGEAGDGRLLLVANTGPAALPDELRRLWPEVLVDSRVVYGDVQGQKLVPSKRFEQPSGHYTFLPSSCNAASSRP